jgi:putative FmdB family regulatory protein
LPIYEYRCEACGHYLDALQKVSDAPLEQCPSCEKPSLKRLISAPAFRLKGGGWYETDFKSDKERKRNLADKPESASKEGKSGETKDGGADKKTGDKPDSKGGPKPPSGTGTEAA